MRQGCARPYSWGLGMGQAPHAALGKGIIKCQTRPEGGPISARLGAWATYLRRTVPGRKSAVCTGEDHVGANIIRPGVGLNYGLLDELQDLPQVLLTLGVQIVYLVLQVIVGQFGYEDGESPGIEGQSP